MFSRSLPVCSRVAKLLKTRPPAAGGSFQGDAPGSLVAHRPDHLPLEAGFSLSQPEWSSRMTLDNKIALVTGGARGLGKSIALAYARAGSQVIICDVNEENLNAAREEVTAEGTHECIAQVCDVSSSAQVAKLF